MLLEVVVPFRAGSQPWGIADYYRLWISASEQFRPSRAPSGAIGLVHLYRKKCTNPIAVDSAPTRIGLVHLQRLGCTNPIA